MPRSPGLLRANSHRDSRPLRPTRAAGVDRCQRRNSDPFLPTKGHHPGGVILRNALLSAPDTQAHCPTRLNHGLAGLLRSIRFQRVRLVAFPNRPGTSPGTGETSQVPRKELLHVHKVSDCARFFPCKPIRHETMLLSLQQNEIGTSELDPFRSSILGPWSPL